MAGASLLTLLDDIASVLDDVALLTRAAIRKTTGVLADDLAVNAQQVSGIRADRELPVVWAVARGSLRNKAILVPAALLLSAWFPWLVGPLLMAGGTYLCLEGVEKVDHALRRRGGKRAAATVEVAGSRELERLRIQGAIRTDLVLSAEIIALSLGFVAQAPFLTRVLSLVAISLIMTAGVYGVVAAIVKCDDAGLYLVQKNGSGPLRFLGQGLLRAAPLSLKILSVAGTGAMFLVGGGILAHGIPPLHPILERLLASHSLLATLAEGLLGLTAGTVALMLWRLVVPLRGVEKPSA